MNSLPFSYRKSTSIIFLGDDSIFMTIIARFFNSNHGGTLLIGMADNGDINDLENDYQTLKKQNQDGLMGTSSKGILSQLGDINS
jgi:hypothetical protein